ncbi:MAG: DUF1810 domain-containing protein [Acidobacteriales bacterium]|nr:DUF1810 domain-containing protein [Terriglobales bacterium]
MNDPFDLQRFVDAQNPVFEQVIRELAHGRKESHWMWFVFPQLKGLGSSPMAERFGITSRAEAEAYLAHTILGPRLLECTRRVNSVQGRSIEQILGGIDALKFRSSMTLFAEINRSSGVFRDALTKYYAGESDPLTLARL